MILYVCMSNGTNIFDKSLSWGEIQFDEISMIGRKNYNPLIEEQFKKKKKRRKKY